MMKKAAKKFKNRIFTNQFDKFVSFDKHDADALLNSIRFEGKDHITLKYDFGKKTQFGINISIFKEYIDFGIVEENNTYHNICYVKCDNSELLENFEDFLDNYKNENIIIISREKLYHSKFSIKYEGWEGIKFEE